MVIHLLAINMSLRRSETLVAALCFCSYVLICPALQRSAMSVAKRYWFLPLQRSGMWISTINGSVANGTRDFFAIIRRTFVRSYTPEIMSNCHTFALETDKLNSYAFSM